MSDVKEADGALQSMQQRMLKLRSAAFEKREGLREKRQAIVTVAEDAGHETLPEDEQREFDSFSDDIKKLDAEILGFDSRIAEVSDEIERAGKLTAGEQRLRKAKSQLEYIHEQATYTKDGDPRRSYFLDLARVELNRDPGDEARNRLQRHATDISTLPEYRALERRDTAGVSRVDGSGGWGVPPIWLMDQYVMYVRPSRAFANAITNEQLPPGTDNINIPKMLTGTTAGIQTADNTSVSNTNLTDENLSAPVRTVAGQQIVSLQLLEQSPIAFDQIVFRDLASAHAQQVDLQVLTGSGSNGQVTGVHNVAGINTLVASAATIQGVYSAIANGIQTVHTTRFQAPTAIFMHPRRWGWLMSLLDNNDRPLFLPTANGLFNAAGVQEAVASQQIVGQVQGLPVITDPNIPTTLGNESGGGTEDAIYVVRTDDLYLWETGIQGRAMYETYGGQMSVLLQVYNYIAFQGGRYPQSIVEITGLPTPTWS